MPTVGEQLASAREAKEWSLEDVARLTKLRSDQVLALEEGRFHIFSAPVYVRGFVKSYAKLVHLDPVPLIEQLNTEINKDKKLVQAESLTGPERGFVEWFAYALSRVPWRIVLPLAAIVALVGIFVWGMQWWEEVKDRDPLEELPPGLYEPSQPMPAEFIRPTQE
jgi:cytoskeletal protein RodZ